MKIRNVRSKFIKHSLKEWARVINFEKRNRYKPKSSKHSLTWNKLNRHYLRFVSKMQ